MMFPRQPSHNNKRSNESLPVTAKPTKRSRWKFHHIDSLPPLPDRGNSDGMDPVVFDALMPLPHGGRDAADPSVVSEDNDANFDGMDPMVLDALMSLPHGPDTDPSVAGDDIALMLGVNMPSEGQGLDEFVDAFGNEDTDLDRMINDPNKCDDEVPVQPLVEDVSNRFSLGNFLPHIIRSVYNLQMCETPSCNLHCYDDKKYCTKCEECGEGSLSIRPALDVEDIAAHPTDDNATGVSEEDAKAVMNSNLYEWLFENPCESPRKGVTAYSNSRAVRNQLGNGILHLGFSNMILSWQRSFQLHLIPPIVYVLMRAFGYEGKQHAPLRELICNMVLHEKLPFGNSFFFTRIEKLIEIVREMEGRVIDTKKEVHEHVSVIIWASLFLLELLAYGESYSILDLLANNFVLDAKFLWKDDKELAYLFASMGYAIEYNARLLVDDFKRHTITKRSGKVVHMIGRCTIPDRTIRRMLLGPLNR